MFYTHKKRIRDHDAMLRLIFGKEKYSFYAETEENEEKHVVDQRYFG